MDRDLLWIVEVVLVLAGLAAAIIIGVLAAAGVTP